MSFSPISKNTDTSGDDVANGISNSYKKYIRNFTTSFSITFFPPSNNRKEVESSLCGKYIFSFDRTVYNLFHFTRNRYLQLNHKKRRLLHTSPPNIICQL